MNLRIIRPRTAGVLLAVVFAASCGDSPSQPASPRVTARLEILAGNGQTGAPGEELPNALTVRALDSIGRPVSGQIINFRVVQGGGSVFAGANVTGADGIAREFWTLGPRGGEAQVLEARAVDNATSQKIVFGTFTATTVANRAHTLSQCCLGGSWGVGSTYPSPVQALVKDSLGNPVPNLPVTWTVVVGNGRLTNAAGVHASTHVVNTDAQGISTIRFTTGTIAGLNVVRSAAGSLQDADSINGHPGVPVRFTIEPASLALGVNATAKLTGFGYDRFNNRTTQRPTWRSLDPAIVTVVSPSATQTDTVATVRGQAAGTGRVVGQFNTGSKVYADTVTVTVQ
jgi:hypothetical protein